MGPGRESTGVKLAPALLGVFVVVVVVLAAWALLVACRRWRSRSGAEEEEQDKGRERAEDHHGEAQKHGETALLLSVTQELHCSSELRDQLRHPGETRSRDEEHLSGPEEHAAKWGEGLAAEHGWPSISKDPRPGDGCVEERHHREERPGGLMDGSHCGEPGAGSLASEMKRVRKSADAARSTWGLEKKSADASVPEGHGDQGDAPRTHLDGPAGPVRREECGASRRERGHGDVPTATEFSEVAADSRSAAKRVVAVPPVPQVADVHFRLHYVTASPWQQLAVTGSIPQLGGWSGFVALDAAAGGFWSGSAALPADSHVEWKFVLVENGKIQRWEECENRHLDTMGGKDLQLNCCWGFPSACCSSAKAEHEKMEENFVETMYILSHPRKGEELLKHTLYGESSQRRH